MEFFATSGSIPVHIHDSKKGDKTILLLHGYLETMYIWNDFFDVLAKKYRVIAFDLPGHGLSSSAPINTMEFIATVATGVLNVCGVEKSYIGGHSLGGYASLACCKMFPERFEGLILFNSHPYPDLPEKKEDRLREIEIIEAGKLLTLAAASIPKMYKNSNLRRLDEKIRETIELCETHDPAGIVASIRGMQQRSDSSDFMKEPNLPVLLIAGDSDDFLPMERLMQTQVAFPKVRYQIIEDTGHNSFIEDQQKTLAAVTEFMG